MIVTVVALGVHHLPPLFLFIIRHRLGLDRCDPVETTGQAAFKRRATVLVEGFELAEFQAHPLPQDIPWGCGRLWPLVMTGRCAITSTMVNF